MPPTSLIQFRTPAKINPYLRVLGKRPDGYHDLQTVMLAIALTDEITLTHCDDDRAETKLTCSVPELPTDSRNLMWRAAEAVRAAAGLKGAITLHLEKRIPWGGGLGGGSGNAAGVLWALNRLLGLGMSLDALSALAAQLGSDVPFFLHGAAAVCEGRGERVQPFFVSRSIPLVLLFPDFTCSTGAVYQNCRVGLTKPLGYDKLSKVFGHFGASASDVSALQNDLEGAALTCHEKLAHLYSSTVDVAGATRLLTGSGSTVVFYPSADNRGAPVAQVVADLERCRMGRVVVVRSLVTGEPVFDVLVERTGGT